MSKGGSSPAGNTTVTTKSDPWSGQQPYLTQGFQAAQNLFNQGGPNYYPGQSYAGPTDLQLTGIENEANLGLNGTQAQAGANGALSNVLSPSWLTSNPSNSGYGYFASGANLSADNPYFQHMADIVKANVLPGIQATFNNGNRLDSGLATRAASEGLGDAIGNLAYNNYQQGLQQQFSGLQGLSQNYENAGQQQLAAMGLAPSIGNLDYQQAAALQDAGQTTQGLNQAAINDALARWNFGQQQPYGNLQNYMQNIQGNYGGTQTQTQPYFTNPTANALSTGIGAFTLGNALTGGQLSSGLGNLFGNLFGNNLGSANWGDIFSGQG
jgi:hypothetical protein